MTEAEWLNTENVHTLLNHLIKSKADTTRLHPFVASFADSQRLRSLLSQELQLPFDDYIRWVQEGGRHPLELHASKLKPLEFDPLEPPTSKLHVDAQFRTFVVDPEYSPAPWLLWSDAAIFSEFEAFGRSPVGKYLTRDSESLLWFSNQADRLREIFGNPFRPVTFSDSWRTEHTVGLATQMYESRNFTAMPFLADALEEAGCNNADILLHCRSDGQHVRGCWVVDLVLGKE